MFTTPTKQEIQELLSVVERLNFASPQEIQQLALVCELSCWELWGTAGQTKNVPPYLLMDYTKGMIVLHELTSALMRDTNRAA
jgi:hypothetical protein